MTQEDSDALNPERPGTQADTTAPTTADFGQLFAEYAPRVKGYLVRRGLSPSAAEELTQEVMLTVWTKRDLGNLLRGPLGVWAFTIARNRYLDMRRHGRRPQPDPDDPCWVEDRWDGVPSKSSAPAPAVDGRAMDGGDEGRDARLGDALAQLSEEHRATLLQLYFEGRSTVEAATALGVTVTTVKSRVQGVLRSLQTYLDTRATKHE